MNLKKKINNEDSVYWTQRINTMLEEDEKEQYIYFVDSILVKLYKGFSQNTLLTR